MSDFDVDPPVDLFGVPIKERNRRYRFHPDPEIARKIVALRDEVPTMDELARAAGVALSTLYSHYATSAGVVAGTPGRRCHKPTEASRQCVREMAEADQPQPRIAEAVGITVPTLTKHYRSELSSSLSTKVHP